MKQYTQATHKKDDNLTLELLTIFDNNMIKAHLSGCCGGGGGGGNDREQNWRCLNCARYPYLSSRGR